MCSSNQNIHCSLLCYVGKDLAYMLAESQLDLLLGNYFCQI